MSDILRLTATAVITALCCLVLRKQTPELALVAAIAGGVLIFWMSASALGYAKDFLEELSERAGISGTVLSPVIKVVGIALVSRTAGEFCKDVKEGGVAAFLDLAATLTALVTTIPLIRAVLNTVSDLI
jgi:stage III sporulation protein AD